MQILTVLIMVEMTVFNDGHDLQSTRLSLVALKKDRRSLTTSSLDVGLDLQAASRLLVVVSGNFVSFDVCFDFHWLLLLMDIGLICGERRLVIGLDGGDHRLHSNMRKIKAIAVCKCVYGTASGTVRGPRPLPVHAIANRSKLPTMAQILAYLFLRLIFIIAFLPQLASIQTGLRRNLRLRRRSQFLPPFTCVMTSVESHHRREIIFAADFIEGTVNQ